MYLHNSGLLDEKKPSLQEIASERSVTQRATGWKIHHVAAQLDELVSKCYNFYPPKDSRS